MSRCVWCNLPLPARCPSEFFCSEQCETSWHRKRIGERVQEPYRRNWTLSLSSWLGLV